MKLYIPHCVYCQNKISLSIVSSNRTGLRRVYTERFTVQCPFCHNTSIYTPNDVIAETTTNSTVGGGVLGGLVGLIAGPLGAIIGAGLGSAIGNSNDDDDKRKVHRFNSSF